MSTRLTFGGSPCPTLFTKVSEPTADLANAICQCTAWDPSLLPPFHANLLGEPKLEEASVPFATARALNVPVDCDTFGLSDVFLDDLRNVFPMLPGTDPKRGALSILLALVVLGRPLQPDEPIP